LANLDTSEYDRWLRSAYKTIDSARRDHESGFYNWACFKSHQAAEKAIKALLWGVGKPRAGHSLTYLLEHLERELDIEAPINIEQACIALDKYYIPTRYPDAWVEGIPEDYFSEQDAIDAVEKALSIIRWVEETWRELLRREG
jgi:HEPN domain-containing protein